MIPRDRAVRAKRGIAIPREAHPSPQSANKGFFGSKPFSRANDALLAAGREAIDWTLGPC